MTARNSSLRLSGLEVADKSEPMKNLFQFDDAVFDTKALPLLEKRVVIDQASLTGLKFGTPRTTSGALSREEKRPGFIGKAVDKLWSQVQQVANYCAPEWPGQVHPQQSHIDVKVDDLDDGERAVIAIGARPTRSLVRTRPAYTASMSDLTIKALAPETFGDFVALVERNKGMFASCWCVHFHPDCAEKGQSAEGNRALKQRLVADGIAHAALVYDGDLAVAWAEYGSPEELPSIHHRKEYVATAERLPDYRVTCILVERGLRGQGLAAIALRGAVELIAQAGGGLVEGYPHDTGGIRKKNSSFLYNGTRTIYEREGFTYDRPKGQGNCVMVREVAPSTRD